MNIFHRELPVWPGSSHVKKTKLTVDHFIFINKTRPLQGEGGSAKS